MNNIAVNTIGKAPETQQARTSVKSDANPQLALVLSVMCQALKEAIRKGSGSSAKGAAQAALLKMIELLGRLQITLGEATETINQYNMDNNSSMLKQAQATLKNAEKQINDLDKSIANETFWDKVVQIIEGIVGAIATVIFALTPGMQGMALLTAGLTVMATSGGFEAVGKWIGEGLEALGVPKKIAEVLGSVAVILGTMLATLGGGLIADAVQAGTEVVEDVAATAAEAAEEGAESAGSFLDDVKTFITENNPFGKLSKTANMTLFAGSQALMSSDFVSNLVQALPITDSLEKDKLTAILQWVMMAVTMLCSLGSSVAMMTEGVATAATDSSSTAMQFLRSARFSTFLQTLMMVFSVGQAGVNFKAGAVQWNAADIQEALGQDQALLGLLQGLSKGFNTLQAESVKSGTSAMKEGVESMMAILNEVNSAQQALTHALAK